MLLFNVSFARGAPDLEAYGKLEQISDVKISPSGELIAYRRTESDKEDFIMVFSLKEKKAIAMLNVSSIDPQGHYFVSEDYLIINGSNHVNWRGYKHDFDVSTAFSFDIKNNKAEELIKLGEEIGRDSTVTLGQSGMGNVVGTSSDGKILYIPAFVSKSSTDQNPSYSLLGVDLDGKKRPRIISKGTYKTRNYFLDSDANIIARENLNDKSNEHSIDVFNGGKWQNLYSYKAEILTHSFLGLSDDFTALVFSRNDDLDGFLELSLNDGSVQPLENLNSRSSNGVIENEHGVVVGLRYPGFTPDYQLTDSTLDQRIKKILSEHEGHSVHLSDWSTDWKHIVVRVEGTLYAGDYFLYKEGQRAERLVSSRLDLDSEEINAVSTFEFKARDGLTIPTILTLPRSTSDKLDMMPAVIMPHGGPAANDQVGFDYMAQAFASRGYLVIQPQFRGSTGFGKDHYEAGWGQWGKGMQNDLTDAVQFLVNDGLVDPERICIVGASYGGYAALAGAAFTPELFKCAVSIAGVSHLPKMLAADKRRYGKKSWVLNYWNRSILAGDFDKNALEALSPYYSAQKIKIPVLLLHGEDDTIVEYEQSKLMYKAMKKAKGTVKIVKLRNDDHYLRDGSTRTQAVKEMVKFVEAHIGS